MENNKEPRTLASFLGITYIEYRFTGFLYIALNNFSHSISIFKNIYIAQLLLVITLIPVIISTWLKVNDFFKSWEKYKKIILYILVSIITYFLVSTRGLRSYSVFSFIALGVVLYLVSFIKIKENDTNSLDKYFNILGYAVLLGFPILIAVYGLVLVINGFIKTM